MTNNKLTAIGTAMTAYSGLTALLAKKANGIEPSINETVILPDDRNFPCIVYQLINDGFYNEVIDQEQFFITVYGTYDADVLNVKYKLDDLFDDKTITYNNVNYRCSKLGGTVNREEDAVQYIMTISVKQLKGI